MANELKKVQQQFQLIMVQPKGCKDDHSLNSI